ncbi:hypothetical protein GCM10010335_08410 [Streptomyces galbus]|nr:hypothetical protein GCM10010335_08410 [Streptomyces galbus]
MAIQRPGRRSGWTRCADTGLDGVSVGGAVTRDTAAGDSLMEGLRRESDTPVGSSPWTVGARRPCGGDRSDGAAGTRRTVG